MHSEAVSGHLYIYLDLGTYGHGMCLVSRQPPSVDRNAKTGYMEEAKTRI